MAGEDVTVTAAGSRLIVRGSPAAIERIREVVRTLGAESRRQRVEIRVEIAK